MNEVRRRARLAAQLQWLAELHRELATFGEPAADLRLARRAVALEGMAARILSNERGATTASMLAT